jgi:hypothetical protein
VIVAKTLNGQFFNRENQEVVVKHRIGEKLETRSDQATRTAAAEGLCNGGSWTHITKAAKQSGFKMRETKETKETKEKV